MRFAFVLFACFLWCRSEAQTYLTRQQAIADIDSLLQMTEQVHYNPYLHISKKALLQQAHNLKQSLPDSIGLKPFLEKLSTFMALLQDGHTAPAIGQPALAGDLKKKIFLPFSYLTDKDGRVFLATGAAGLSAGSRLLSVNGIDVQKAKTKAAGYVGGLPAWKQAFSDRLFTFFLYLQGAQPPFKVIYSDASQNKKELLLAEGVDFNSALSLSIPAISQPAYTYEVKNGRLGYINFVSMGGGYNHFFHFLDSAFNDMQQQNIRHLAVDLRHNTGGDSNYGEILLAYITSKNFSLSGKKNWKVSPVYKNYLLSRGDSSSDYHRQKAGTIWTLGYCGPKERKVTKDTVYDGQVYFLTGSFTFSSANMLADGIRQYNLATLVGEPTGESTNDFGEVYSFTLPHSKLRINSTTSFDVGADCNENHNKPVMPHVLIQRTVQHILANEDPVLDYVLKQAAKDR
jgi:hypothetical protein